MAIGSARRGNRSNQAKPSSRKANATGYAKRQSRKVKTVSGLSDIYDYQPEKNRRANISLSLDKDETTGFENGDEEEEGGQGHLRPRLIGEDGENQVIGSDDDEEIESDDAFEESDDDRFAGFKFADKGSKNVSKPKNTSSLHSSKRVHFSNVNLDEEDEEDPVNMDAESQEEEEEGEEGDEFIDLLDILDGKGTPDGADEDSNNRPPSAGAPNDLASSKISVEDEEVVTEDEDEDEDTEPEDELAVSGSESDVGSTSAIVKLGGFIAKLETGTKRKAGDDNTGAIADNLPAKKKRSLEERAQGGVESEFGARTSGSTKLSLDDLLAPLSSQSNTLTSLKNAFKPLNTSLNPKNQPLPAPLPQRSRERVDREIAYEQTKQEVDKWNETMKRIKDAEHLSFPLQPQRIGKTSNLELTAKFHPTTELESSIDKLLKSAKLREDDIAKTEELAMNHLSQEEVAERRNQLKKVRELMFRNELKAKRVAKIKSKTYRRIQKKEKAKMSAKLDAENNGEDEDEDEARLKKEVERARERATLKHKNTRKWTKAANERGESDEDQRRDINEMLERDERLQRKIRGRDSGGSDDDTDEEGIEGIDELARIKSSAFEELSKIGSDATVGPESNGKGMGIFEMKFMKEAAARQNREVDQMVDDFRKELGAMDVGSESEGSQVDNGSIVPVQRTGGRVIYRPGDQTNIRTANLAPSISDTSTLKSSPPRPSPLDVGDLQDQQTFSPLTFTPLVSAASTETNPWLQIGAPFSKIARKKNEVLVNKDSQHAEKSQNALKKNMKKSAEEREKEKDDAIVEISVDDTILPDKSVTPKATKGKRVKKLRTRKKKGAALSTEVGEDASDSDGGSEVEEQEKSLERQGKGIRAFEQRDLVARAFAGDNVVQDFEDAKRREIAADAPREESTMVAGWGSWGGAGTKRPQPKPHLNKKIAGIDPKSRADYNKSHVIISEKRDKKAAKYTVKDLPYPYTSKAQFERSMDNPLGTEWNTRVGFQRGTLPRVVKKMGTAINPIEKLF